MMTIRMLRIWPILVIACFCASEAVAAETPDTATKEKKIHYLADLKETETTLEPAMTALRDPALSAKDRRAIMLKNSSAFQSLATYRAFAGDDAGALGAMDFFTGNTHSSISPEDAKTIEESRAEDAIAAIIAAAEHRQIVILNEAHHVPMHRAFAIRLARELRKIGYTTLAAETLSTVEDPPLADGYVKINSGYYSREPVFSQFLHEAKAAGWKLVPYEYYGRDEGQAPAERMLARERGEAKNLMERIFAKEPKEKTFIYVGYSHAAKAPLPGIGGSMEWMAMQLGKLTGIDPLCIDQTAMYERSDLNAGNTVYKTAVAKHAEKAAFVLKKKDGVYALFNQPPGAFDFQVIHPPVSRVDGRAAWLQSLAGRKPMNIPADLLPAGKRRLIYAFYESDGKDAVPVDAVLIEPGKPVSKMMLPPGAFRYDYEE